MAEITNETMTNLTPTAEEETVNSMTEEATVPDVKDEESSENIGTSSEETDKEQGETAEDSAAVDAKNRQDFEKLKTLPYLDLFGQYRSTQKNIADLKSAKAMLDQIGDLNDSTSSHIAKMDALQKSGFDADSIKEFYSTYDENIAEGNRIIDLMARMLLVYDSDMLASTAFISKSAIEAADARVALVDKSIPNAENALKRIEVTREAYANRVDFSMIFHKLRFPHNVLKVYAEFSKDPDKAMKYVDSIFMNVFNDQYMKRFRAAFKQLCFDGADAPMDDTIKAKIDVDIFFVTYWLAHVYEQEYNSGKCAYVKTLVMNVYDADPSSNIYDLCGGVPYLACVCFTIYSVLAVIISGNFTSKEIHDSINTIMDDVMAKLLASYQDMIIDYPGRFIQIDTSFESITDGMIYDELPNLTNETPDVPEGVKEANTVEESIDEDIARDIAEAVAEDRIDRENTSEDE